MRTFERQSGLVPKGLSVRFQNREAVRTYCQGVPKYIWLGNNTNESCSWGQERQDKYVFSHDTSVWLRFAYVLATMSLIVSKTRKQMRFLRSNELEGTIAGRWGTKYKWREVQVEFPSTRNSPLNIGAPWPTWTYFQSISLSLCLVLSFKNYELYFFNLFIASIPPAKAHRQKWRWREWATLSGVEQRLVVRSGASKSLLALPAACIWPKDPERAKARWHFLRPV